MKKLLTTRDYQVGFTLIELLIVVVIIAVLIAVGAVSYTMAGRNSRDAKRASDLQKIAAALEEYYADHRTYPITPLDGFESGGNDCRIDKLCCLFGGAIAETEVSPPPSAWKCTYPFNQYIDPGFRRTEYTLNRFYTGTPVDPLVDSKTSVVDWRQYTYNYASNGQEYILTSIKYEGNSPTNMAFSPSFSSKYWNLANTWRVDCTTNPADSFCIDWDKQIAIKSPQH